MNNKTINYVKCIKCNTEWARESSDGLCNSCMEKVEVELAVLDLWKVVSTINAFDNKVLNQYKESLNKASIFLKNKVKNL